MRSFCRCTLIVIGRGRDRIREYIEKRPEESGFFFDFDKVMRCPLVDGTREAYSWRLAHWGTGKLGFSPDVQEHKSKLHINFETVWTPPEGIVRKLIADNPDLRFILYYEEESGAFKGMLVGEKGKVVKESYKEGV